MASIKEHCEDCVKDLGNPFKEVHEWLDEYCKIYWTLMIHRIHRHHLSGVEEIRHKWGDEAAKAAVLHIQKDEGCVLSEELMRKRYRID